MIRFGDMQLGKRFWVEVPSDDERDRTILLTKMPHVPSHPDNWNAFDPNTGRSYHIDTEEAFPLEHEGTGDPVREEDVDETSLEFLLGQFVVRRGESKAAHAVEDVAGRALYLQLAADGRLWEAAYEAAKKAGLWVSDEKDEMIQFRQLISHLQERGTR